MESTFTLAVDAIGAGYIAAFFAVVAAVLYYLDGIDGIAKGFFTVSGIFVLISVGQQALA
jgi:hypothetical protein